MLGDKGKGVEVLIPSQLISPSCGNTVGITIGSALPF